MNDPGHDAEPEEVGVDPEAEARERRARIRRRALSRYGPQRRAALRPLKVLLLGRTDFLLGGGIARSLRHLASALESVGDVVRRRSVFDPLTDIPPGTDIIIHYGDRDRIKEQIAASRRASVPMVVNSVYDGKGDRCDRIWMDLGTYDPEGTGLVLMGVFTHAARRDPRLAAVWDRLVTIPKTIRPVGPACSLSERSGICLGEVGKLGRRRLVGGMDVAAAIDALHGALPGVKLTAYAQYASQAEPLPDYVRIHAYDGEHFLSWLGRHRLYVMLTCHETFGMVPAEAQALGVPVLYRPMPQSHSEHMGVTGFVFETIDELVLGALRLYHDDASWERFSAAGYYNGRGRALKYVGASIDLELRRALLRVRG